MSTRQRLGDVLLERELITREQLDEALARHRLNGRRLGEVLVSMGAITQEQLTWALSEAFHIPFVELSDEVVDLEIARSLPEAVLRRHEAVPDPPGGRRDDGARRRSDESPGCDRARSPQRLPGHHGAGCPGGRAPLSRSCFPGFEGLGSPGTGCQRAARASRGSHRRQPSVRAPPWSRPGPGERAAPRAGPERRPRPSPSRWPAHRPCLVRPRAARADHVPAPCACGPPGRARAEAGSCPDPARRARHRARILLLPDAVRGGRHRPLPLRGPRRPPRS